MAFLPDSLACSLPYSATLRPWTSRLLTSHNRANLGVCLVQLEKAVGFLQSATRMQCPNRTSTVRGILVSLLLSYLCSRFLLRRKSKRQQSVRALHPVLILSTTQRRVVESHAAAGRPTSAVDIRIPAAAMLVSAVSTQLLVVICRITQVGASALKLAPQGRYLLLAVFYRACHA